MSKILVTGGAGFIGSHIVNHLFKQGNSKIRVLDNFSVQIHGNDHHKSFLYQSILGKAEIIVGDVRNSEDVLKALDGVDQIIHLAAETGTGQSMYALNNYTDVNIMGLSNLFEVIAKNKLPIKKIVLSSSRSVYGEGMNQCPIHGIVYPNQRKTDDMLNKDFDNHCPICNAKVSSLLTDETSAILPISYYAFTKFAQEKMIQCMCPVYGIDYTIFRFYNVFGVGQSLENPYTGIVSIFSKLLLQNKEINVFEDGLESRDFVNVSDVAEITCLALNEPKSNGQIINIGTGESVSVMHVAQTLKSIYNSSSSINITGDFRIGDIRHNTADISNLKRIFNCTPKVNFNQGISELAQWVLNEIKATPDALKSSGYEKSMTELSDANLLYHTKETVDHEPHQ